MILKTLLRIVFRFEDEGEKGILNYLCGRSLMLRLFLYWFSFVGRYQMTCWLAEVGVDDPRTRTQRRSKSIHSADDLLASLAAFARNRENENTHHAVCTNKYGTYKQYLQTRLVRTKNNSQRNASPVSHGGYIFFFPFRLLHTTISIVSR